VTLADKKGDLREVVKRRGGTKPESVLFALRDVLDAALDNGDAVRAYIVANELDDFAEGLGVAPSSWSALKAQVLGKHKQARDNTAIVPGMALYRTLCEGGEGTLAGYITYARSVILTNIATLQATVQRSGAYWQDGVGGPRRR
jgi:hypothetical protein